MSFRSFRYAVLVAPFLLTACGEGYEMIKTDTLFPYGNQRTAGSGVAYVLARMAPQKELNLAPAEEPKAKVEEAPPPAAEVKPAEPAAPPEEETPMEKVFNDAHEK